MSGLVCNGNRTLAKQLEGPGSDKICSLYERTSDSFVYIIGGGDSGYGVVRTERQEECWYRADEVIPWTPLFGDNVVEADSEPCATGLIVEVEGGASVVKWPHFQRTQVWQNSNLEPAWRE